jgi:hypothetical protein
LKLVAAEGRVDVGDERVLRARLKGYVGQPRDRRPAG